MNTLQDTIDTDTSNIQFVTPTSDDIQELNTVEKLAWSSDGENITANNQKIINRIKSYSKGVSLAINEKNEGIGSQFAFKFNWDGNLDNLTPPNDYEKGYWDYFTNEGNTETIHKEDGNTGFLVGVGVVPDYRGVKLENSEHNLELNESVLTDIIETKMKISQLLIVRTLDNLFNDGVSQVLGITRLPFWHKYPELSIHEYMNKKNENGDYFDPVLRFHANMGAEILVPVENSMEDAESLNGGAWISYKNPVSND